MTVKRPYRWFVGGLGVGLVVGLILGVVAYARLGPDAYRLDVGVQAGLLLIISVSLAALAGAGGAVGGSIIASNAAHETTRMTLEQTKLDRDEARRARFNDRTRELAAQLLASGFRYRAGAIRQRSNPNVPPARHRVLAAAHPVHLGVTAGETQRELCMILRNTDAREATNRFAAAIESLMDFVYDKEGSIPPPEWDNQQGWTLALREFREAANEFEIASIVELGGTAGPEPTGESVGA